MKRALLIEWNPQTGVRAGGINPKDPKLPCYGWQNMDVSPAVEIRLIEDNRGIQEVPGVKLLEGVEAINEAIRENIPTQYWIEDMILFTWSLDNMAISPDDIAGLGLSELAEMGYAADIPGTGKREPQLLEE